MTTETGKKYQDGWAFPWKEIPGMTLRDWFAGMALQGMVPGRESMLAREYAIYAKDAYAYADAMIEARKK